MNELKNTLQVIILCAGEGSRLRNHNSNIPKSLIQIQSMDNKPLLEIIIDDLINQGLINIIIILGFMSDKIESHISRLKRRDPIINSRILTLKAHPDYKKGPLYTFLTIFHYPDIIKKDNNFLIFPGDTVFDQDLLNDILMKLMKEKEKFQGKPIVFYRRVKTSDIKKKTHRISIVKTIKKRDIEILSQIEEIKLSNSIKKSYIDQIIPIFFLNYDFLQLISQILKSSHSTKIKDILNEVCNKNLQEVIACEIASRGFFYDIDTVDDLEHLNKKKVDNSSPESNEQKIVRNYFLFQKRLLSSSFFTISLNCVKIICLEYQKKTQINMSSSFYASRNLFLHKLKQV